MTKIVVTDHRNFTVEQRFRLDSLGNVTCYRTLPASADEYLDRIHNADIICSGTAGLREAYPKLKDVYITVPFVSVAFLDLAVLKKNNVALSNAPGANRHAVAEWIIAMALLMLRNLPDAIRREETYRINGQFPETQPGLAGRKLTILGRGNIGKRVGELAACFGMEVNYFTRDDDLLSSIVGAEVIVDTLSSNSSTLKLLNREFFNALKFGSYFITITRSEIVDDEAMLGALDEGRLAGAASDCGGIEVGDTDDEYYQRLLRHPKLLVTPHISYNSSMSEYTGLGIMIDNVESWLNGKPQNLL